MINKLLGDRVLVKLDSLETHSETDNGIVIPLYEQYETDGGRPAAKLSNKKYLSKGEVIDFSPLAAKKLEEQETPITKHQRVYVNINAVSPNYQFFPKRDSLVIDFDGYILIPYTLIEAYVE